MSSELRRLMMDWANTMHEEWSAELTAERKPWLWNKVAYAALDSAAVQYMKYLDNSRNEMALVKALSFRRFAEEFMDQNTDREQMAESIVNYRLSVDDQNADVECPEWLTEEEWELAQDEAVHDEDGKLIQPQVESFLIGNKIDEPCLFPTEFDKDVARAVVTKCMKRALQKVTQDFIFTLRNLKRPNTSKWRAIWQNRNYDAKTDLEATKSFIKQHDLNWEE